MWDQSVMHIRNWIWNTNIRVSILNNFELLYFLPILGNKGACGHPSLRWFFTDRRKLLLNFVSIKNLLVKILCGFFLQAMPIKWISGAWSTRRLNNCNWIAISYGILIFISSWILIAFKKNVFVIFARRKKKFNYFLIVIFTRRKNNIISIFSLWFSKGEKNVNLSNRRFRLAVKKTLYFPQHFINYTVLAAVQLTVSFISFSKTILVWFL